MVRIQLLGSPSVVVDGLPLTGDAAQRRRMALLAVLAAPPLQPRNRDWLVGLLWPENDSESARHLLSASIHVLRKALGAALQPNGDTITLSGDHIEVDCEEFRRALVHGEAEAAVALYRGPFLESFFVKNSPELEHWIDGERAEYARLYRKALTMVATQRTERGDVDGAIEAWRSLNAVDPLDAESVIGLMDALVAKGDRAGALRQAHIHAQLLEQELGARADANVEARAEQIRTSSNVITPAPQRMAAPSKAEPVVAAQARESSPPRRDWLWLLLAAVIIIGTLAARVALQHGVAHADRTGRTVVVSPFVADPRDTATAYIATGMTEQIASWLAQVKGLRVRPMTSSRAVGSTNPEVIGRKLRADYVIDGSLSSSAIGHRITINVTSTKDPTVVWTLRHDVRRDLDNLFAVEDSIATTIVNAIDSISGVPLPVNPAFTPNPVAADYYLRGLAQLGERTPQSLRYARYYFLGAVSHDPRYAAAYAALALTHTLLGSYDYGAEQPGFAFSQAQAAAQTALSLDSTRDDAYAALGSIHANYDWDFAAAEADFRRALQLRPDNSQARQWYALALVAHGQQNEALAQIESVVAIDRLNVMAYVNKAHVLYYSRRYDGAAAALDEALRIDPFFNRAHMLYALVDIQRKRIDKAVARLEDMAQYGPEPTLDAVMTVAQMSAGRKSEAQIYAHRVQSASAMPRSYVAPEIRALAALALGQNDSVFVFLNEALRLKSGGLMYLEVEPLMDPLRRLPQYKQLVEQLKQSVRPAS